MKIDVHELSIGNLVTVNNPDYHPQLKGVVLRVTGITPNEKDYSISLEHINQIPNTYYPTYSQFLKFIEPIPLTEEWLLRFGFKKNRAGCSMKGLKITFDSDEKIFWVDYNFTGTCELRYVHQLQNIYFALTGNELKSKTNQP
jgi:hypothetical protein